MPIVCGGAHSRLRGPLLLSLGGDQLFHFRFCEGHRYNDSDGSVVGGERWWREEGIMEISSSSGEKNDTVEDSVWMELYQVGHLGFGRVSFSGIQPSQVKGN
uniref:Uncharacterized protein n=1 Tax=Cannabis sativa TaxID=3483 RepID=A0A803QJ37_CANSA